VRIWKEFCFEAAHLLPNLPVAHKCSRLHGHSYRFRLHVEGEPDLMTGWVVDFGGLLRAAGDLILVELDHRYLNDIPGLDNPTAERLAEWIWLRVEKTQLRLCAVEVFETCATGVWYEG
jgi:6-pyruvoyltetrahydropterin/6-carboxytetrahydropterin synthase